MRAVIRRLHLEAGRRFVVLDAPISIVSRGDSTLRGDVKVEVEALAAAQRQEAESG